jgi:hypothetical protein
MLEGMFGQKLVQHFSLPVSSSLVLRPTANTQIAMTRMTMPNGFPRTHSAHYTRESVFDIGASASSFECEGLGHLAGWTL